MPKLRPFFSGKWLISHIFVLIGVVLFINLGLWQLRRANEKANQNTLVESRLQENTCTPRKP